MCHGAIAIQLAVRPVFLVMRPWQDSKSCDLLFAIIQITLLTLCITHIPPLAHRRGKKNKNETLLRVFNKFPRRDAESKPPAKWKDFSLSCCVWLSQAASSSSSKKINCSGRPGRVFMVKATQPWARKQWGKLFGETTLRWDTIWTNRKLVLCMNLILITRWYFIRNTSQTLLVSKAHR